MQQLIREEESATSNQASRVHSFIKKGMKQINSRKFIEGNNAVQFCRNFLSSRPDASTIFPRTLVTATASALALRAQYQIK